MMTTRYALTTYDNAIATVLAQIDALERAHDTLLAIGHVENDREFVRAANSIKRCVTGRRILLEEYTDLREGR